MNGEQKVLAFGIFCIVALIAGLVGMGLYDNHASRKSEAEISVEREKTLQEAYRTATEAIKSGGTVIVIPE